MGQKGTRKFEGTISTKAQCVVQPKLTNDHKIDTQLCRLHCL